MGSQLNRSVGIVSNDRSIGGRRQPTPNQLKLGLVPSLDFHGVHHPFLQHPHARVHASADGGLVGTKGEVPDAKRSSGACRR